MNYSSRLHDILRGGDSVSIGGLQRRFRLGFNRAARLVDQLSEAGIVGPDNGTEPREVLVNESDIDEWI